MKKRYIASPFLLMAVALTWNIVLRHHTPVANAEALRPYLAPSSSDPRHPIEVFKVGLDAGATQAEIISHLPTTVYPEDKVKFIVDPAWGLGTVVQVQRAMPVTIHYGRKHFDNYRTWSNTVQEVLAEKGLTLVDQDTTNHKNSDILQPGMEIDITPVSVRTVTTTESIPYDTVTTDDPTVYRHQDKVTQDGQNGVRTKTYRERYEDGDFVSSTLVSDDVTTAPVTKKISKGTKIKPGKIVTNKQASWYEGGTSVASTTFPIGTHLMLINQTTGKQVEVVVDDTGAFGPDRVVDLNPSIFQQLGGSLGQGLMNNITAEEILNP